MVRECPQTMDKANADAQPWPNYNSTSEPSKRNQFYTLKGKKEQEMCADVVTGTLHAISFSVYALLDPGSTLLFVSL